MNAGFLLVVVYWVIFTVRKHFTPKATAAIKANAYDMNRATPDEAKSIARKRKPLTAAKWALRVAGWVENALAVLMITWLAFLIGAILTGTVVVFGYPV